MHNKTFQNIEKGTVFSLKQTQKLMMSSEMQQALNILQLPLLELVDAVYEELEKNPLLEEIERPTEEIEEKEECVERELEFTESFSEMERIEQLDENFLNYFSEKDSFSKKNHTEEQNEGIERFSQKDLSLFALLMHQMKELSLSKKEEDLAELIIGNLDERGFLEVPLEEISFLENVALEDLKRVLTHIQSLEPFGLGASNLQESLLLQLLLRDKKSTLAYQIIENHYEDLLNSRTKKIEQGLKCSKEAIKEAIHEEIKKLDFCPGKKITKEKTEYIIPDLYIEEEGGVLFAYVNDKNIPEIGLNRFYMSYAGAKEISNDDKKYMEEKVSSAKWFIKNIFQRNKTLKKIGEALIKKQRAFFLKKEGPLEPLNMKWVALEIEMHESTVARAISNKYVETPRGVFPLKHFFSSSLSSSQGKDVSSRTVKEAIKKIIEKEDKKNPYSDDHISKLLKEKGITCARRTVAKFRGEQKIGNTLQRRE